MTQVTLQKSDSQAYHVGSQVWVPEKGTGDSTGKQKAARWVKGRVSAVKPDKEGGTILTVHTEEGAVYELKPTDCPLQNERDDTVDDLVKSDFLHEPGILHTLRVRYTLDMIYTYSGSILIAANPHKRLRHLYGSRMMSQYKGVPLGELSPHVYAIAEQAFAAMMIDEQRQAILISGESGAGKTESAKMVMQYLAQRAGTNSLSPAKPSNHGSQANGTQSAAPIEEQVLESNPLLEAFGNAKTVRNDNSSRFGKFTEIDFDVAGRVSGAAISTYLLERSRVVSINSPERSYHIFYQLCAGASAEQRKAYGLEEGAAGFQYLAQSSTLTLPGVDDGEGLRSTLDAMAIVGLTDAEIQAVLRTVAAVLHLGNLAFKAPHSDESVPADQASQDALSMVATLLMVDANELLHALTTRAIETAGERIVKQLDTSAALESRDSLAKNLYARLFDWLVAAINRKISALGTAQRGQRTIGILDIYGFESFKENSFEQLCINLANERLQQQFNQHVFKGEQEEYAQEGIDWSYVEFVDNQDCLDLLEGAVAAAAPSLAVFPLIDEACRLPRATYQDLAHTLRTRLVDKARFVAPKRPQHSFGVEHYAGRVTYATTYLMDKNKDFVVAEHQQLLRQAGSAFIQELFEETEAELAAAAAARKKGGKSAFKLNSVGAQFRKQLQGLMATLNLCQPHYIRCIKPNPESRPGSLTPPYVLEQLRAGGVLEAVRIASAGFPTRKPFRPFAQRYCVLLASGKGTYQPLDMDSLEPQQAAELSRKILQATKCDGWQLGKTRVFLRAGQLALLEGARGRRLTQSAIIIQSAFRSLAAQRQLKTARRAATSIQAAWRGRQGRNKAHQVRRERAALCIQSSWRMHHQRKAFLAHRKARAATVIQAYVRMVQQRTRFRRQTELGKRQAARAAAERRKVLAAVTIQKNARRLFAAQKVAGIRAERARWTALEEAKVSLEAQVAQWKSRYEQAAGRSDELAANVARLQSELLASRLEVQNATDAADAKAALARRQSSPGVSPRQLVELEEAQAAAQATLMAELDLMRRQKAAAEEQARRADHAAGDMQDQWQASRGELEHLAATVATKERENSKLWEQVRSAAQEYHAEFAAKEATIAMLIADAEATRQRMQADIDKLRTAMEAEVASVKSAMQKRVEEAVAETEAKASGLRDAREKNLHFSARVVALNSRVANLQKAQKEAAAREKALLAELEATRQAVSRTPAPARNLANGAQHSRTVSLGTPARLLTADALLAGASYQENSPATPGSGRDWAGGATLDASQESTLSALQTGVLSRRLPILQIPYGNSAKESIGMPVAAWILGECLLHWAGLWRAPEVELAATRMREAILSCAETEGLQYQAYCLSTTLALGAFLKVRGIGRKECDTLYSFGDKLIQLNSLHSLLAISVSEMLPVNVNVLLSEDAKRLARGSHMRPAAAGDPPDKAAQPQSFETIMSSPWKGLLGGLSNVLETMRGDGVPPPACRAVVYASLRYLDAELLNALMLRRECCSISAVKALKSGLSDILAFIAYMGPQLCGEMNEAESALEHSLQAAGYLLSGKDECVRKVNKGMDITADMRRMCPALTLPQIYKLTEYHHDDWITGGQSADTLALLETLKRIVDSANGTEQGQGSPTSEGIHRGGYFPSTASQKSWDEEETLLLDSQAAFVLPRKLLVDAARFFVQAPRSFHNAAAPGISLLDRIEISCRSSVQLPRPLKDRPEFSFLKSG